MAGEPLQKIIMETWRDIPSWEGAYQVSDCGRVRSLDRTVPGSKPEQTTRVMRGKILAASVRKNGYRMVELSAPGGVLKRAYVHHLVLLAFVGPRPEWCEEIRHLNGIKIDCRLANLEYGTCRENAEDRKKHGQTAKVPSGHNNCWSKLSPSDVEFIRMGEGVMSQRELARIFKVSHGRIGAIWRRESYL